jgi:hypothetical protein
MVPLVARASGDGATEQVCVSSHWSGKWTDVHDAVIDVSNLGYGAGGAGSDDLH